MCSVLQVNIKFASKVIAVGLVCLIYGKDRTLLDFSGTDYALLILFLPLLLFKPCYSLRSFYYWRFFYSNASRYKAQLYRYHKHRLVLWARLTIREVIKLLQFNFTQMGQNFDKVFPASLNIFCNQDWSQHFTCHFYHSWTNEQTPCHVNSKEFSAIWINTFVRSLFNLFIGYSHLFLLHLKCF